MDSTSLAPEGITSEMQEILHQIANTIRGLSIDGVQAANSGHPGLPLGCAEMGAYLYAYALRHNPLNPKWTNRDRFILSAGHGSMFLYSCLHLAGFNLSLDELKNFRQLHSKTPGHPESLDTEGVETTTGPLGQGVGNAVGQALGLKLLAAKFNTPTHQLFDSKVFCLVGDGDIMEGISAEVSSLAGHLHIDNLIVFYDANKITLDGPLTESCSEDTAERYRAYGWDVYEIDGYDFDAMHQHINSLRENQTRPTMLLAHTIIGKGSPNKAGTHKVHGAPLGPEELESTKENLGIPKESFFVPEEVSAFFKKRLEQNKVEEGSWNKMFEEWAKDNPKLFEEYEAMKQQRLPNNLDQVLKGVEIPSPIAGRKASNLIIQKLAEILPQIYGGSADLSCSDLTMLKNLPLVTPGSFAGRNIKYGVREFGMATIATGLSQTGMITPFIGTFLTFSDYMRNAIRLAALQSAHVIYQFTHDSIFLGEDGPTHQPVEHYAALRAIPKLHVIRPGDAHEVAMAWVAALRYTQGPTALIFSRQNLPTLEETNISYAEGMGRGAYIVKKENKKADFTLVATGSELHLALNVAQKLHDLGKDVRVISMPCWELFEQQSEEYKRTLFAGDIGKRVSIEAGVEQGWHKYIGSDGIAIAMRSFGLSAPYNDLVKEFGFNVEAIVERII